MILNSNLVFAQISNYKYLGEETQKIVLPDKHFNLFFSLKDYYIENVFFLENGILLWDKKDSKFVLIDYNSSVVLDEFRLTKKAGFKKDVYNFYNPYFYNSLVEPLIINSDNVTMGIVKTKRKLGYRGYQILNVGINNKKIKIDLIPFKPKKLFENVEYINPEFPGFKYKFDEGLAVLQYRNMFPLANKNGNIYQFFGKPFINAKKKNKSKSHHIFNPSLFIKNKHQVGKFLFPKRKNLKSNMNLFQLVKLDSQVYAYRSIDDSCYNVEDNNYYKIIYKSPDNDSFIFKESLILTDRKRDEKYILRTYISPGKNINYHYEFYKINTIDKLGHRIISKLVLAIDSKDKLDFSALYGNRVFIKRHNPIIPDEIGLYYIDIALKPNHIYYLSMKKGNIFSKNTIGMPRKINVDSDLSNEYRLLNSQETDIFPNDSSGISDITICQSNIKCLLKTVKKLFEDKKYKYVFTKLMLYNNEDISLLDTNKALLSNSDNFINIANLFVKAYDEFDKALWIKNDKGLYEGTYPDEFVIFAIKQNDKYYLSIDVFK